MRSLYVLLLASATLSACGSSGAQREAAQQRVAAEQEAETRRQASLEAERTRQAELRAADARQQAEADSVRAATVAEAARLAARPVRYARGSVNVRSAPNTAGARVAQLAAGDSVYVEDCAAAWCRVSAGSGATSDSAWTTGYVSEPLLHESPAAPARPARRAPRRPN